MIRGKLLARRRTGDEGGATTEMVLAAPLLIALALTVVALGRYADARNRVTDAAHQAARAASISRINPIGQAREVALRALANAGVTCRGPGVTVSTSALTTRATVRCPVGLTDLTGIGLPGHRTITGTFTSPVDPWRAS